MRVASVSPSPPRPCRLAQNAPAVKSDSASSVTLGGRVCSTPALRTDLCVERLNVAQDMLTQQYSHRTPRSITSPARSPRSDYWATSPRGSTCASSPRQFFSGSNAEVEAQKSYKMLERELAVLRGLTAEVAERIKMLDACAPVAANRQSTASSASAFSSARPYRQAGPAVAEAAEGVRAAAPVGARHRNSKSGDERETLRGSAKYLFEGLQQMTNKMTIAHTLGLNLIAGIQDSIAAEAVDVQRRQKRSSISFSVPVAQSPRRVSQAVEQRATALHRSLNLHIAEGKTLCKEARALGARVIHELTATCELFEVSSVQSEGDNCVRGTVRGECYHSPLERIQPARQPVGANIQVQARKASLDVDDMMLTLREPSGTPGLEPVESVFDRSMEALDEESCRLDLPERGPVLGRAEVLRSRPAVRHVWQMKAL